MRTRAELEAIESRLRAAGVQPTAQRLAIARFVLGAAEHPSAEDVKAWADENFHKLSLATVYNTLGALVRAGLLKEVRLPHNDRVVYDDNVSEHYHFLDERTGKIFDVDPARVAVRPRLGKEFRVRGVEVLLRGTREGRR
ncbi:MAG TPA: Fur family transcriptional regulator [Elusimicrobiota bacterium]|jgi:Fur family iron response transcriptional regulator|nr:Fur family transcriptional regulator [Elusimicrobiota bacterium]